MNLQALLCFLIFVTLQANRFSSNWIEKDLYGVEKKKYIAYNWEWLVVANHSRF